MAATPPTATEGHVGPEHVLLAKNFDWHLGGGYLVKSPRGIARRALPLFGGESVTWVSVHGGLTTTQYGVGHDLNQNGRYDADEPLVFFRPNPVATADTFGDLAFDLAEPTRLVIAAAAT